MSKFDVGDQVIRVGRSSAGYEEVYEVVFVTEIEGVTGYGVCRADDALHGSVDQIKQAFSERTRGDYLVTVISEEQLDLYRTPVIVTMTADQYKRLRKADLFRTRPPALKRSSDEPRTYIDWRGLDD